jgi:dolichol-phosphate mannosyltransferase
MRRKIHQGQDVVIASRYRPASVVRGVPVVRRILSQIAGWLLQVVFPLRGVRDYTCGFRAYRAAGLQRGLEHYGATFFDQQGFQCMVDILLKLRRLDLAFTEVPIVLRYDWKETPSKMHVWQTVYRTLRLIVKRRFE